MENIENDPLALIRARHNSAMEEDFISQETEDMGYLLAALDAVVALHKTLEYHEGIKLCVACSSHYNHVVWPCPTVGAVSAALGGVQ